jgi:hypothetical protein
VRVANCSGFYGDRLAAAREMVDGGPIDVLTGDYLAELTMLILAKAQAKDPGLGYARTFLTQVEEVLGPCLERGIKIVSNAGGLNAAGLAAAIEALGARVAYVEGDDLRGSLARSPRRSAASRCRPTPTSAAGASPLRWRRARTSSSPGGSPTRRSSSDRPRGGTAGARPSGTRSRARSSPGT